MGVWQAVSAHIMDLNKEVLPINPGKKKPFLSFLALTMETVTISFPS